MTTALTVFLIVRPAWSAAGAISLTDKNAGQTVKIAVGQTLHVRLPSNPSTGYRWSAAVSPAGPLAPAGAATYQASSPGLPGGGGAQTFPYHAVAAGTVHLSFDYARSWEHVAPAKHIAVTIVVTPS